MNDNVVSFRRACEEVSEPHMSGAARCTACAHEWEAVAPVGVTELECSNCRTMFGLFVNPCTPATGSVWVCNCGSDLFHLTPKGAMCRRCGVISNDWAD